MRQAEDAYTVWAEEKAQRQPHCSLQSPEEEEPCIL